MVWKRKIRFSKFSGMSLYFSIGVGSGFSGMVSGGTYSNVSPTLFINIKYVQYLHKHIQHIKHYNKQSIDKKIVKTALKV